jgi:hypothetical protein
VCSFALKNKFIRLFSLKILPMIKERCVEIWMNFEHFLI